MAEPNQNNNAPSLMVAALHVVKGGAYGALGYIGGAFVAGVSTAIGFTALGSLPLGVVVGSLAFTGYAVDQILSMVQGQ